MSDEIGFERRLWQALHPTQEWSEEVTCSEEYLLSRVVSVVDACEGVYKRLHDEEKKSRAAEAAMNEVQSVLWDYEGSPSRPPGATTHHVVAEIRDLQVASASSVDDAVAAWGKELKKTIERAGEAENELEAIEKSLSEAAEEFGVEQPTVDGEPVQGERWIRHSLLRNFVMKCRGLVGEVEYAKTGQRLWNDMFSQIRDVAVNHAPVVAHCQAAEHIYELCHTDRFNLEVERRIHRPSEAIEIRRSVGELYTTDEQERKRRLEQESEQ